MSPYNYYEIFMTQFVKTLAQLSAGILSASVAVPMYSYYVHGRFNLFDNKDQYDELHKTSSMDSFSNDSEDDDNLSNEAQISSFNNE